MEIKAPIRRTGATRIEKKSPPPSFCRGGGANAYAPPFGAHAHLLTTCTCMCPLSHCTLYSHPTFHKQSLFSPYVPQAHSIPASLPPSRPPSLPPSLPQHTITICPFSLEISQTSFSSRISLLTAACQH